MQQGDIVEADIVQKCMKYVVHSYIKDQYFTIANTAIKNLSVTWKKKRSNPGLAGVCLQFMCFLLQIGRPV